MVEQAHTADEPTRPRASARRGFRLRRLTLREALIVSGVCAAVSVGILMLVLRGLPGDSAARSVAAAPASATADRVPASPRGVYRVTGRVQLDELPNEFFLPPASGLVAEELMDKRDLVLDGAVLLVGEQATNDRFRQLVANIIRLEDGARIVTNGARLEIMANQIVSEDGQIIAFEFVEAARRVATAAPARPAPAAEAATAGARPRRASAHPEAAPDPGRPSTAAAELGTHGARGGLLRLTTLSPLRGRLAVRLNGQDGAPGEPGEPGYAAVARGGGGDLIGDLIDCSGGRGVGAGAGGAGGAGGDAGDGGVLELAGAAARSRELIAFQGEPGVPAQGGPGGPGGAGGYVPGDVCGYGPIPPGPPGGPGALGRPGVAGRVILIPEIE